MTGPWDSLGELACLALDLQLKLYDERLQDTQQGAGTQSGNSTGSGDTLFEAAATKVAASIGEGDTTSDLDSDIQAVASLPPSVLARAFGESWERIPYITLCSLLKRLKNDVNNDASISYKGLFDVDVDEWYVEYRCLESATDAAL